MFAVDRAPALREVSRASPRHLPQPHARFRRASGSVGTDARRCCARARSRGGRGARRGGAVGDADGTSRRLHNNSMRDIFEIHAASPRRDRVRPREAPSLAARSPRPPPPPPLSLSPTPHLRLDTVPPEAFQRPWLAALRRRPRGRFRTMSRGGCSRRVMRWCTQRRGGGGSARISGLRHPNNRGVGPRAGAAPRSNARRRRRGACSGARLAKQRARGTQTFPCAEAVTAQKGHLMTDDPRGGGGGGGGTPAGERVVAVERPLVRRACLLTATVLCERRARGWSAYYYLAATPYCRAAGQSR